LCGEELFLSPLGYGRMEKGKRTKSKGLGGVLGKTKADVVGPVACGVPVPG